MQTQEHDLILEALSDQALSARLRLKPLEGHPLAVSDEQLFRLFRLARSAGNEHRRNSLAATINQRLLARARGFARKNKLVPNLIGDLQQASSEIAMFIWVRLLDPDKTDSAFAEKAFGKLFEHRAIDFLRSLRVAQREKEVSLDDDGRGDDEDNSSSMVGANDVLQDNVTPEILAARRQLFDRTNGRLREILTPKEYETYVMLYVGDYQVQEIARALKVSVKSINNYKNSALAKIEKEFKQ
ncbi:MAG: hypothetical protein V4724_10330 [Pseudomonadota bacterium]